jgi:hypothetical protein
MHEEDREEVGDAESSTFLSFVRFVVQPSGSGGEFSETRFRALNP